MSTKIKVFLSHNSADKPAVETLAFRLRAVAENDIEPWLDKWNLIPGDPWQKELENEIGTCAVAAVFVGPHGFGSWHHEEMRTLISRRVEDRTGSFRVIPVLLPGAERGARSSLPKFLVNTTWVEFHHTLDDDEAFQRLVRSIRGKPDVPPPPPGALAACPYRGLKYFDIGDSHLFFGRAAVTEWLVDDVRKTLRAGSEAPRFVAILGASGSGKSSLARAGLYEALKKGAIEGSDNWLFVPPLRPGSNPLESLEIEFLKAAAGSPHLASVATHLKELATNPAALHRAARQLVSDSSPPRRVFLFVDQFEEIFTECDKAGLRGPFLAALLYAARERGGPVIVVLAMRADFYPKVAAFEELARVMDQHQFLVGPMSEDELRQAIEVPAYRAGADFDPGLVDKLIEDVRGQPGALPLLQHALAALWRERVNGRQLTHDAYKTMGGLSGALEKHANRIFDVLTPDQQKLCEHLFLRLVHPGEGAEDTKRRVPLTELTSSGNPVVVAKLIATLSHEDNRLIITEGGDESKSNAPAAPDAKDTLHSASPAFVEVAHEALIRSWSRLRKWIDADRSGLRTHRRLTEAAKEWEDKRRHPEFLYSSGRLAIAREWTASHRDQLTKIENEFLAASRKAERVKTVLTATLVALIVGILGWIAFWGVWSQYNTYWAELGGSERPNELIITRQLKHGAPFKVSTGFTRDLLLFGSVTNFGFPVPNARADWRMLENKLVPSARARLQFATRLDGIGGATTNELVGILSRIDLDEIGPSDLALLVSADPKVGLDFLNAILKVATPKHLGTANTVLLKLLPKLPTDKIRTQTDLLTDSIVRAVVASEDPFEEDVISELELGHGLVPLIDSALALSNSTDIDEQSMGLALLGIRSGKFPGVRATQAINAIIDGLKHRNSNVIANAALALEQRHFLLPADRIVEVAERLVTNLGDKSLVSAHPKMVSTLTLLAPRLADKQIRLVAEAVYGALSNGDLLVSSAAMHALVALRGSLPAERLSLVIDALIRSVTDREFAYETSVAELGLLAKHMSADQMNRVTGLLRNLLQSKETKDKLAAADAFGHLSTMLPIDDVVEATVAAHLAIAGLKYSEWHEGEASLEVLFRSVPPQRIQDCIKQILGMLSKNVGDSPRLLHFYSFPEEVAGVAAYSLLTIVNDETAGFQRGFAANWINAFHFNIPERQTESLRTALLLATKSKDNLLRKAAIAGLTRMSERWPSGRRAELIDSMLESLRDSDDDVVVLAMDALIAWCIATQDKRFDEVANALLAVLMKHRPEFSLVRHPILIRLGEDLPPHRRQKVVEMLWSDWKEGRRDFYSRDRSSALNSFVVLRETLPAEFRTNASDLVENLLGELKDKDGNSKFAAADALGHFADEWPPDRVGLIGDSLLAALKGGDADIELAAVEAFGKFAKRFGPAQRAQCFLALVERVRRQPHKGESSDNDQRLRAACYNSLRKLTAVDSEPETRVLLKNLEHLDSRERLLAIYTLPRRTLAPAELEQIRRLRNDPQNRPWVRMAALETLVEIAREEQAVAAEKEKTKQKPKPDDE